jgi:hypothetical protein
VADLKNVCKGQTMTRIARASCVFAGICVVIAAAMAQTKRPVHEPTVFSAEDEDTSAFRNALPPSNAVLDALLKTTEAQQSADELQKMGREEQRELFHVVPMHLSRPDEVDWIVLGSGPMSGADNEWYWVVHQVGKRAEVLLFANGLALNVLWSRTNGYKDIETSWAGNLGYEVDRYFHYDGTRYKLVREHTSKLQSQ